MNGRLDRLLKDLEGVVGGLEPEVLESSLAQSLVQRFTAIERVAAAGKALAARRVAESGAWRHSGEKSAAHWMAKATGTSVGQAVGVLETAARLSELPGTDAKFRKGDLSEAQVREIASAAAAAPASEGELLKAAETEGLTGLKERCAKVRAAALPDESARYQRIHNKRRLRHWSDPDGAFRMDALLTPDAGATVLAALEGVKERIFHEARKQGRRESYEAYGADALVEIAGHVRDCKESPERSGPQALVHVVVDHQVLRRGSVAEGETCEIAGVGPVPAATARELAVDALVAALITDGVDIKNVTGTGRTIPARVRTALKARGMRCAVPGCGARHHLQIDHIQGVSDAGPTKLDNLDWLCPYHHYLKTHLGYVLGGKPGARTWTPPDPKQRPPPGRPRRRRTGPPV